MNNELEISRCPKCGCTAYTKQGQEYAKYKGQDELVLKFRRKCKYCGCKYTVNIKNRHNLPCPKCGSGKTRKAGIAKNGFQMYYCTSCKKHFQDGYVNGKMPMISEYKKDKIRLYARGGFSDKIIASIFGVGSSSVNRIRKGLQ